MDKDTALALMQTVSEALTNAADCQLKIGSLERVLKERDPALYEAWKTDVENLRKRGAVSIDVVALNNIASRLARE